MRRLIGFCLVVLTAVALHAGPASAADTPVQRFVVFFQSWSAAIDEPATNAIGKAAAYVKDHPGSKVRVIGFADTIGSKAANILLSELRSQVVADQLMQDGVAASRITQTGRGSVQFALTSQESRRVEIAVRLP